MEQNGEQNICGITEDELEVIRRIRRTTYGRIGVHIKDGQIMQIDCSATVKPPSLEKAQQN